MFVSNFNFMDSELDDYVSFEVAGFALWNFLALVSNKTVMDYKMSYSKG